MKIWLANGDFNESIEHGVVTGKQVSVKKPSMYQVLLLNDDFTPMDFVVDVLKKYFHKGHAEAIEIMLSVHHQGRGICGVYTYDIAETKVRLVLDEALKSNYPLQCCMEKV